MTKGSPFKPSVEHLGGVVTSSRDGSRSRKQGSGTVSTVTLDEADVAAGAVADTNKVMVRIGHCIEHLVGVQAARTLATVRRLMSISE